VPIITKAPTIKTREELIAFLTADPVSTLRPLAKVVAVTNSVLRNTSVPGLMTRRRVGQKEKNHWRQYVEPIDSAKAWFPPNFNLLVEDRKVKET